MKNYKYALGITSQVPFCSVPLRLDAYDKCQFSCTYCFAKARGGFRSTTPASAGNSSALRQRLQRVESGRCASALDEMLSLRIPIQFGGMTDPFSPIERRERAALDLLKVLADYDYPTLISTKSDLLKEKVYIDVLRRGNFYVRVSFTGGHLPLAHMLEKNLPSKSSRLVLIERLADSGIASSARLQPIILGHEEAAEETIEQIAQSGARHVSVEYLKLPLETSRHQNALLARQLPGMRERYAQLGATRVGREYVLPSNVKLHQLLMLKQAAGSRNIHFGFAENDLLHLNGFESCCNAADLFLRNFSLFHTNVLSAVKTGLGSREIKFSDIKDSATPIMRSINNYLNSTSRSKRHTGNGSQEWLAYLREKWNGPSNRGGPSSFWGCVPSGRVDGQGDIIYDVTPELARVADELNLGKRIPHAPVIDNGAVQPLGQP